MRTWQEWFRAILEPIAGEERSSRELARLQETVGRSLYEHLCPICRKLNSCELGTALCHGDYDQWVRDDIAEWTCSSPFRDPEGDTRWPSMYVVVSECEAFEPTEDAESLNGGGGHGD